MATGRSPEVRKDIIFNKWVIFSPARARRPSDFKSQSPAKTPNPNSTPHYSPSCPFCIGNEHDCAPEIFRIPQSSSEWKVRVIENLYPALCRDQKLEHLDSMNLVLSGFGFHDVVIETPDHSVCLSDLSAKEIGDVLLAYRQRIEQFSSNGSVKYVQVFKNHGASAGASLSHSHSQIIGLSFVPPSVSARFCSTKEYFDDTRACGLCKIRSEELLIDETSHFFSIVPLAASFPFEIWIVPQEHSSHFHQLDNEKAIDLGSLLKLMLIKLSVQLNDPPFNFMIHSSPFEAARITARLIGSYGRISFEPANADQKVDGTDLVIESQWSQNHLPSMHYVADGYFTQRHRNS